MFLHVPKTGGMSVTEFVDDEEVPTGFRNRIAADNQADIEFYRFANAVVRERVGSS